MKLPPLCPHLDALDERCLPSRLDASTVRDAVHYCAGAWRACPIFRCLESELPRASEPGSETTSTEPQKERAA
ncbi:MAG: hypothetical protein ACYTFT_10835 [Planctomycetota bacterium]|jgi:hypothetical protein